MNARYLSLLLELYIYAKLLLVPVLDGICEFVTWSPAHGLKCHLFVSLLWNAILWKPNLMLRLLPAVLGVLFFSSAEFRLRERRSSIRAQVVGTSESMTEWFWRLGRYLLAPINDKPDKRLDQLQKTLDFLGRCIDAELSFATRVQLLWLSVLLALHLSCWQILILASNTLLLYHSPAKKLLSNFYDLLRREVEWRTFVSDVQLDRFARADTAQGPERAIYCCPSPLDSHFQYEERLDMQAQTLTLTLSAFQCERWWSGPGLGWLPLFKSASVSENEPLGPFSSSYPACRNALYFFSLEGIEDDFARCFPFWTVRQTDWTCGPWEYGKDDWSAWSLVKDQASRVRRRKLVKSYLYEFGTFRYRKMHLPKQ